MMVGSCLKQILHLEGEFNDTRHLTEMKDRCIYDVAIHHSFVSRSYRKDLSSCATTFCF